MEHHITKQLSAAHPKFSYVMTKKETLVVDIMIASSVSFVADVSLTMNAAGGNATVRCIVLPKHNASVTLITRQIHVASSATSNLLVKSVIIDASTVTFQGNVSIGQHASKSDAYQKNENLLFGTGGVINTSPTLEILNNDVRCTHGVTTGTIPDDVAWYMRTRGLSETAAKSLYIDGFIRGSMGTIQKSDMLYDLKRSDI
ncbi:MAG: SufD family Fe-S cluster assembly protein [Microgenomates group bacterium]